MSQASGAARETSMDEILASIRKIIEESDAAASAAEAESERAMPRSGALDLSFGESVSEEDDDDTLDGMSGLHEILDADDQVDQEIVAAGEAELNAFREAINDRGPASIPAGPSDASPPPKPSSAIHQPMSLADIQAKLSSQADSLDIGSNDIATPADEEADGGEREDDAAASRASDVPAPSADVDQASPGGPSMADGRAKEPVSDREPAVEEEPEAMADTGRAAPSEDSFRAVAERLERRPAGSVTRPSNARPTAASDDAATSIRQGPADLASGLAPIVSREAGKAVADSFGQLKDAFFASRQRDFDQMAEEMLRPMLQDWLDNNLPTLVERLVKEEIERIAQGG